MRHVTKILLAFGALLSFALLFGWESGIILLVGIGIHEYGHMWAMRVCGIKTKGFYFLPFLGGVTVADEEYGNLQKGIFIALMEPILGFFGAFATLILAIVTNNLLFYDAAYIMAWLNLINLAPIYPLDGGRVLSALMVNVQEKTAKKVIYGAIILFAIFSPLWIFCIIGAILIRKELLRLREFNLLSSGQWNTYFGIYIGTALTLLGVLGYISLKGYSPTDLHIFFA